MRIYPIAVRAERLGSSPMPADKRSPRPAPKPRSFVGARPPEATPPPLSRGPSAATVEHVFGLRAGLALFHVRRADIQRVFFSSQAEPEIGELLRWCAAERVPAERMDDLARVSGSTHHEGLCVNAAPRKWATPHDLADALAASKGVAIALDRVRNPYNIGAILRTAAFFGVKGAILGAAAPHPALPPDAVRVAEGGAEHLLFTRTTDLAETLGRLRKRGITVMGADGASDKSVFEARAQRPLVIVMGHEREGLGQRIRGQCDSVVAIPGTGAVESLNVAAAAAVLIAEAVRRGG